MWQSLALAAARSLSVALIVDALALVKPCSVVLDCRVRLYVMRAVDPTAMARTNVNAAIMRPRFCRDVFGARPCGAAR
ncbi:MAG: hypothetical protein QG597_2270 [Actinomycetota bacterium]|nr:hypothetical protein [Actinomycetota bacterium]